MSPDLERRLRDGGNALAGPAAAVTDRARETAVAAAAAAPSRRGGRSIVIGGAVLVAVALGVAIGSFAFAGRSTAAGPQGLGFLPADGWVVLQSGTPTTAGRPGAALAANVPLHRRDTADGFPYSTLQALPEDGVVLIASFFRVSDAQKSTVRLPLRLQDAVPYIRFGGQARPERPLGQYELRAVVEGYAVEVHAYFGTPEPSAALLAEAQRQLDRLVVSPEEASAGETADTPTRSDAVTIAFQRYWYPPGNYFTMRFFGTISSAQAGEYVTVMKRECGAPFGTAIAGTLTLAGGGWEATPDRPPGGGEFWARWKDEESDRVTYRQPIVPWLEKAGPGKLRATVITWTPPGGKPQSMKGKPIELQRLAAGQWVRMRTARLVAGKGDQFLKAWVATFTVATKGLRLRAYVPAKTAAPCFGAGASKPVKS